MPANKGMWTQRIVKYLDVSEDVSHSLLSGRKMTQVDTLTFQVAEKALGNSIEIALVGYALTATDISQVLTLSEGSETKVCVDAVGESVAR